MSITTPVAPSPMLQSQRSIKAGAVPKALKALHSFRCFPRLPQTGEEQFPWRLMLAQSLLSAKSCLTLEPGAPRIRAYGPEARGNPVA